MLRGVFADGGTASGAAIPGYDLAGKTGTANIAIDGKYSRHRVRRLVHRHGARQRTRSSWSPVIVDEPQGSIYGGSVAAPAFQKIVGWAVPYFGISPPVGGGFGSASSGSAAPRDAPPAERGARPTGRRPRPSTRRPPTAAPG